MSGNSNETAGETRLSASEADTEVRLRGEDELGAATGLRDLAGLAIAVCLFLLALLIYNDASGYPVRQSYAQFGPEIFPYITAIGVAVLAAITGLVAWRGGFEARDALNLSGFAWIVAAICVQIVMLYAGSGFILASAVLFAFSSRAFGQVTHVLNLAIGFILSATLFLLFRYGLGLSLPSGPLERLIDQLFR
jgi:putative tricarboxylic transport membrane protein